MIIDDLFSKKQGIAEGGIATVGWPDEGNSTRNNTPVSVGGTFDARPGSSEAVWLRPADLLVYSV